MEQDEGDVESDSLEDEQRREPSKSNQKLDSVRIEKFKVKLLNSDKEVHKLEWEVINLLNSNQVLPLKSNGASSPLKIDIPMQISPIKLQLEKSPVK